MKKLTSGISKLMIKYGITELSVSRFMILENSYCVSLKIIQIDKILQTYYVKVGFENLIDPIAYSNKIALEKSLPNLPTDKKLEAVFKLLSLKILPQDHELLPDVIQAILEAVEGPLKIWKSGKYVEVFNSSLVSDDRLEKHSKDDREKQKSVMDQYVHNFNLNKDEQTELHRFFSPLRLVAGLTKEDIYLCIKNTPNKILQREFYLIGAFPSLGSNDLFKDIDNWNISRTEALKLAINFLIKDVESKKMMRDSQNLKGN